MVDMGGDFKHGGTISPAGEMPSHVEPGSRAPGDEIESLQMPDGTWVICDDSRFWLHRPAFLQARAFSRHLLKPGDPDHTRQLLAGALSAGRASRPAPVDGTAGQKPSLQRYVYWLAGTYQTTHVTPGIMRHAAGRLRADGNCAMARYCSDVADQESGHDLLALKDLEALGIRSADFVRDVRPLDSVALAALFRRFAESADPISALGYAYAGERFAVLQTRETIDAVEAIVPPGTMATRCLRVHSAVGSDPGHVAAAIDVIARLSPSHRVSILHAAFETAACMMTPTEYPGDEAISELLSRYAR